MSNKFKNFVQQSTLLLLVRQMMPAISMEFEDEFQALNEHSRLQVLINLVLYALSDLPETRRLSDMPEAVRNTIEIGARLIDENKEATL